MRTKTLLIAAAALAATVISSEAQTVYSANVVGYINVPIPANQFVLLANPLDDGTNTTTSLGQALPNKSAIEIWNGAGFTGTTKVGGAWSPDLSIPPGTGFFVNSKTATNITFVGSVVVPSGGMGTNALPAGSFVMIGSQIPMSGDLNDTNATANLGLGSVLANKSSVQIWNGSGFTGSTKVGGTWTPDLSITPAEGFFVNSKTATNWVQTAPF
jgi:hypothetical protein